MRSVAERREAGAAGGAPALVDRRPVSALLGESVALLGRRGVRCALIGAGALAAHGIARATLDLDLLVADRSVLEPGFWDPLRDTRVMVRSGGAEDPLAGVVQLERADELVDVVVGKMAWQQDLLARARPRTLFGVELPVASVVDLITLKLYAGGPQDAWDVSRLLEVTDREAVVAQVDAGLNQLPPECARLWRRVLAGA